MQLNLTLNLTEEQIKKIRKDNCLSKADFQECMDELVEFIQADPLVFLEQLDWFNY